MKNRRKKQLLQRTLFAVILFGIIVGVVIFSKNAKNNDATKSKEAQKSTEVFDKGRLKLIGSMEYEGPNFENGSMEIGTYTLLKIQNISEDFLRNADIEVKVNASDKMSLTIDALPAGETVFVLGQGYSAYSEKDIYKVTSCESSYEKSIVAEKEGLEVSYEAGKIQIKNQTTEEITGILFRYKGKVENVLFGGNTYEFTIDSLPAGETFETDCQSLLADNIQIVEIKE